MNLRYIRTADKSVKEGKVHGEDITRPSAKADSHRYGNAAYKLGWVSLWQGQQALTEQIETMFPAMGTRFSARSSGKEIGSRMNRRKRSCPI